MTDPTRHDTSAGLTTTPPSGVVLPGPWTPTLDDAPTKPASSAVEGDVLDQDGQLVRPAPAVPAPAADRLPARRPALLVLPALPAGREVARTAGRVVVRQAQGHRVLARRAIDAATHAAIREQVRSARAGGDPAALAEWLDRLHAAKDARRARVRALPAVIRAAAVSALAATVALAGLLLTVGILLGIIQPFGIGWSDYWHDLGALLRLGVTVMTVLVPLAAAGLIPAWLLTAHHAGRDGADLPAQFVPAGQQAGRDVIPDERAITNALRNLNMPALNKKFREGWTPRWLDPPIHDGKGWHARLLLPEGVTVEMIVNSKPVLAHNLLRLPVEVWPTEPRDKPGVLDLWVADQGSLTKPVGPWPLLTSGTADYFKGVPVAVDPRGKVVLGRLFQANWGVAGMMGSGKSTLIITALLGAILDPLVEVDVYCMAVNADYDPLRPRLRTLFVSDDPDEIPTVLTALKQLMSELSERGRKLSEAGEPKLTRALAEADPSMRPRVVVIDECQELFVSDVGDEAAELVEKIVAKARKYGVTLIFATPVPSADSLPRKVAKVLSNRACFAIGDHQGNDAILGTGKHRAGISATTLRPMTVDADGTVDLGDLGTAMASGFTPTDGLLRCFYVRRGDGVDQVTPVVERAMAMVDSPPAATADDGPEPAEEIDHLADIRAVIRAAGPDPIMRTQEVLARLAALRPELYRGWTFERLRKELPDSARPYKTRGHMCVNADRVAAAMADRDTPDPTDDPDNEFDTA